MIRFKKGEYVFTKKSKKVLKITKVFDHPIFETYYHLEDNHFNIYDSFEQELIPVQKNNKINREIYKDLIEGNCEEWLILKKNS